MAGDQPPRRPDPLSGANAGWAAISYLIAGIGVWGFLGWLVDEWLGIPQHYGTLVGMIIGMAGAVYLIVKRMSV
jgi:F0F1-type ATP synthase assembly protein I